MEERETNTKVKKVNFYDLSLKELEVHLSDLGKAKFRARQLFKWVYEKRITDVEQMTDVSKTFRAELPKIFYFQLPEVTEKAVSRDGTIKLLFDVSNYDDDGVKVSSTLTVEAVLIPSNDRVTICVSSEVGCNIGCRFCYTGKTKLKKRLSTSEILGQFLAGNEALPDGKKITNVVFMGMGEPLDNPSSVFGSIEILQSELGINFSRKKITVSTSGLIERIPLVTEAGVRLAVSLNASNDLTRTEVMPINKKYNIKSLLNACKEHSAIAKDKVTLEYVLLRGITDSIEHARELFHLTKNVPCKLNLIAFNEHPESDYKRPTHDAVLHFKNELIRLGAHVLVRKTMGRDIYAACGQLTSKAEANPVTMPKEELSTADYSYV